MPGRAFVLIFLFWALLTIVTPTLVILSASANPSLDIKGEQGGRMIRARRMMGYVCGENSRTKLEVPAPAPAPAPARRMTGFMIQVAHLKSEHLDRGFHGHERAMRRDVTEAKL